MKRGYYKKDIYVLLLERNRLFRGSSVRGRGRGGVGVSRVQAVFSLEDSFDHLLAVGRREEGD